VIKSLTDRPVTGIKLVRATATEEREKILKRHRDYRQSPRGRGINLLNSSKRRAKLLNLEFDLTLEFLTGLLNRGVCPRTGIVYDFTPPTRGEQRNGFAPSLDRKDRTKGYTQENVQIVVWCYNSGKGEMNDEDFIAFCKAVAEYNK